MNQCWLRCGLRSSELPPRQSLTLAALAAILRTSAPDRAPPTRGEGSIPTCHKSETWCGAPSFSLIPQRVQAIHERRRLCPTLEIYPHVRRSTLSGSRPRDSLATRPLATPTLLPAFTRN